MKHPILTFTILSLLMTALFAVAQSPYTGGREYVVRYTYDGSGNVATRRATLVVLHDELDSLDGPGLDTTIVIYPDPTPGPFSASATNYDGANPIEFQIYSVDGNFIDRRFSTQSVTHFDISDLPAGTYVPSLGITNAAVAAMVSGAIGGASGALVGSILNGSNLWQTVKSTITGGLIGGALGVLNYAAGAGGLGERLFKHVIIDATMSGLQGGNIFHGAMTGVVNCLGGYAISRYGRSIGEPGELAIMAIAGGTVAEIGGGKFANGALTASFSYLFNDVAHRWTMTLLDIREIWHYYHDVASVEPLDFYTDYIKGDIGKNAKKYPKYYQHACAAKLSYALNKAGFTIDDVSGAYVGGDGVRYFIRADEMKEYLNVKLGQCVKKDGSVPFGIFCQDGFSGGITGHMDVMFKQQPAQAKYENKPTYYWPFKFWPFK